jgi:hypothetical protein
MNGVEIAVLILMIIPCGLFILACLCNEFCGDGHFAPHKPRRRLPAPSRLRATPTREDPDR